MNIEKSDLGGCYLEVACENSEDLTEWIGYIPGPPATVYEGRVFKISVSIPENYPYITPS
jgi:ubiquitin-protein ligase